MSTAGIGDQPSPAANRATAHPGPAVGQRVVELMAGRNHGRSLRLHMSIYTQGEGGP